MLNLKYLSQNFIKFNIQGVFWNPQDEQISKLILVIKFDQDLMEKKENIMSHSRNLLMYHAVVIFLGVVMLRSNVRSLERYSFSFLYLSKNSMTLLFQNPWNHPQDVPNMFQSLLWFLLFPIVLLKSASDPSSQFKK